MGLSNVTLKIFENSRNIDCQSHGCHYLRGEEIAQSLASVSVMRVVRVRAWLDPLVTER